MHEIQQKILELAKVEDLDELGLRGVGRRIGVDHPQKVKFHIEQLQKKGFLEVDDIGRLSVVQGNSFGQLLNIPILGRANCGEPLALADQQIMGFLKVTPSIAGRNSNDLFAVKAVGNSMNRAFVDGTAINDGDYVLVNSGHNDPDSGEYILATIDGGANIKKFVRASADQVMLVSESNDEYPPIVIDEKDGASFLINGRVERVISMLAAI